jgi:hypothetical protein
MACRTRSQSASVATVASGTAVQNAGWKYGVGSDMRLTVPTGKANRAAGPIAIDHSSTMGARLPFKKIRFYMIANTPNYPDKD